MNATIQTNGAAVILSAATGKLISDYTNQEIKTQKTLAFALDALQAEGVKSSMLVSKTGSADLIDQVKRYIVAGFAADIQKLLAMDIAGIKEEPNDALGRTAPKGQKPTKRQLRFYWQQQIGSKLGDFRDSLERREKAAEAEAAKKAAEAEAEAKAVAAAVAADAAKKAVEEAAKAKTAAAQKKAEQAVAEAKAAQAEAEAAVVAAPDKQTVFWSGMATQIDTLIARCKAQESAPDTVNLPDVIKHLVEAKAAIKIAAK